MTNKIPNTPFATRLSGSAKETQLRIRSMFQWKKKRPPVWLFTLIVVVILGCIGLVSCREKEDTMWLGLNARVVEIDTEQMILYIQDIDENAGVFGQRCALDCKQAAQEERLIFVDYETSDLTRISIYEFQVGDELIISMYTSQKEGAKDASARAEQVQLGTQRPVYEKLSAAASWYSDFLANYHADFETETYTGVRDFSNGDRILIYEDGPENVVENLVSFQYYCQTYLNFDELADQMGSDALKLGVEHGKKNAQGGSYFKKITLHDLTTLSKEDFAPGGKYFSDSKQVFEFVDRVNYFKDAHGLAEYAVVYADLFWQWSEKALSMGPQLGDGRYERLYLVGKTSEDAAWKIYECFWGEQVLGRTLPEKTVELPPEGKPLLVDYFQQWYDRVYFLGEEPGKPQEGDLRIDSVRFLGSEVTFETTGEAYLVRTSFYSNQIEDWDSPPVTKWRSVEQDSYLVLGRGMDGELYEVRGDSLDAREGVKRLILEVSYGVSDWEVTLRHEANPYPQPLALGWWNDMPLSLVREEPIIERLEGWEPIHWEGDYWERYTLDGLSILRQYSTMANKNNYVVTTVELTRDDFSTPRGIKLGRTRDEVKTAYPELKSGDYWGEYPGEDYLWYCEDPNDFGPALIFFFENDKVSKIILNNMFN